MREECVMSDTQIIKNIQLPLYKDTFRVYPYGDNRKDGTPHQSSRIIVRVRVNHREVSFQAIDGPQSRVVTKCFIDLPTIGCDESATVDSATRFTIDLNRALTQCAERLQAYREKSSGK